MMHVKTAKPTDSFISITIYRKNKYIALFMGDFVVKIPIQGVFLLLDGYIIGSWYYMLSRKLRDAFYARNLFV